MENKDFIISNRLALVLIQKAIVEAQISAFGCVAANTERERNGYALAYDDVAFQGLIDEMNRKIEEITKKLT